jgi:hypothetical protein
MPIRSFLARHRVLCAVLATLLLASLLVGGFFLITSGREYTEDGLLQNSRAYLSDLYYKDGLLHYTVVNKTFKTIYCARSPLIEKQINGEWVPFPLSTSSRFELGEFFPRFSSTECVETVNLNQDLLPGSYRISLGHQTKQRALPDGRVEIIRQEGAVGFVGYITISQEDAPAIDADMYYAAPYRYHRKVTMSVEAITDPHPLYRYQYHIMNNGNKPLVLPFSNTDTRSHILCKYTEEWGGNYQTMAGTQVTPSTLILQPGEEYLLPFELNIAHEAANQYELEDGRYHFLFRCYWEGEEATSFMVAANFTVTNGTLS